MNKRATIGDVARLAGVSTATVSRAIHTPDVVSESTREAVQSAISETGFTLNIAARTLRQQRANAVLVLVPDIGNTFFSEILAGIEKVASARRQTILIGDTAGDRAREERFLSYLVNGRADGALLLNGHLPAGVRGAVVSVSEALEPQEVPHVGIDNAAASALAVRHLKAAGHRRIAHLSGPQNNILTRQRIEGFRAEAGPDAPVLPGAFTIASGRAAADAVLTLDPRPTAVACANDEMAIGLIAGLAAQGVRVPQDISVIGFDDIAFAEATIPALTTIRQPRLAIGERAMMRLISAIEGTAEAGAEILHVKLVERASVAPPA